MLLAAAVSCRKADTPQTPLGDSDAGEAAAAATAPSEVELDPLDECQALLDKAVKLGASDPAGGLKILDQADDCLRGCTYTANQVYWLQMHTELKQAREKLTGGRREEDR